MECHYVESGLIETRGNFPNETMEQKDLFLNETFQVKTHHAVNIQAWERFTGTRSC